MNIGVKILIFPLLLIVISSEYLYSQTLYPYRKGNKWGYCNLNKQVKIRPSYDFAEPFINGLGEVKNLV